MDASATISLGGIMKRTILVIVCTLMGYGCATSKKPMVDCDSTGINLNGKALYLCSEP